MTGATAQDTAVFRALAPDAPTIVGTPDGDPVRIGRYLLRHRIAYGGMGDVFLATMQGAKGFERTCVVKMMRPERAGSRHHMHMFVDEARITAAMRHPNIVQCYDFGEEDGTCYLVLEHLEGEDLRSHLGRLRTLNQQLPALMAVAIAARIAEALAHVHGARDARGGFLRLVHRDVSPANVMLLSGGGVKLLDFGVAKAAETFRQAHTASGVVKGKLAYMAPEQLTGGRTVDARTDIWGLGVLLWEMLTGGRPYQGTTAGAILGRVLRGLPRPPSEVRGEPDPEIDRIVLRCLARNQADRYQSAGEVAEALRRVLARRPWDDARTARELERVRGVEVRPSVEDIAPVDEELFVPEPTAHTTRWQPRLARLRRRMAAWQRRLARFRPRPGRWPAIVAVALLGALGGTEAVHRVRGALQVDELAPEVITPPQRPVIILAPEPMTPVARATRKKIRACGGGAGSASSPPCPPAHSRSR